MSHDFQVVYRLVDERSGGRCEVNLMPSEPRLRCTRQATQHYHVIKPRRAAHTTELIVHLCSSHHDRCAWPYHRGRLGVIPIGEGRFTFVILFAPVLASTQR